jgi:hypothetical protein
MQSTKKQQTIALSMIVIDLVLALVYLYSQGRHTFGIILGNP